MDKMTMRIGVGVACRVKQAITSFWPILLQEIHRNLSLIMKIPPPATTYNVNYYYSQVDYYVANNTSIHWSCVS
jgi:hypothetical protein